MNYSHPSRFIYGFSVILIHVAFVLGFGAVLFRQGRLPDISLRHLEEARLLVQREDYAAAAQRLRVATSIAPEDDQAQYLLGMALGRAGDLAGAKTAFQRVVLSRPTHAPAHFQLGLISLEQNDLERAIWHNRIVLKLQPENIDALTNVGVALLRQGRHAEAAEQFRAALRLNPGFLPAQKNLDFLRSRNLLPTP